MRSITNVIGPILYSDWLALRMLNTSIKNYLDTPNPSKYTEAIKAEKEVYSYILDPYIRKEAA